MAGLAKFSKPGNAATSCSAAGRGNADAIKQHHFVLADRARFGTSRTFVSDEMTRVTIATAPT
jgi:hypothetical protein